jgi:hypothetical protein
LRYGSARVSLARLASLVLLLRAGSLCYSGSAVSRWLHFASYRISQWLGKCCTQPASRRTSDCCSPRLSTSPAMELLRSSTRLPRSNSCSRRRGSRCASLVLLIILGSLIYLGAFDAWFCCYCLARSLGLLMRCGTLSPSGSTVAVWPAS